MDGFEMWNPQRFFRNLCAYSFAAVLAVGILNSLVGGFATGLIVFFVPFALCAFQEGAHLAMRERFEPDDRQIWWVSRSMAEVYLAFLATVCLLLALSVQDFRMFLAEGDLLLIFSAFAALTGIACVTARWSFALGVKLEIEHRNNNAG